MKRTRIYSALVAALFAATSLFAADIDLTGGGAGYSWKDAARTFVLENSVDFSAQANATNQVYNVITITAPALVKAVYFQIAATGNVGTAFTVGDGTDPDGWIVSTTLAAVGSGSSVPAFTSALTIQQNATNTITNAVATVTLTPAYGGGKYYSANDTIDLSSVGNIPTVGKVNVKAVVVNLAD